MKRLKFEDGDVFEIFLSKSLYAYCRVIGRNEYSPLFELFKEKFRKPQDIDALKVRVLTRIKVVFLNDYSLKDKKKARFVGNLPLSEKAKKHPPVFQGSPGLFWAVFSEDKTERFKPDEISYEDLLKKGFVDSTNYSSESVVDYYLKGKPLVFGPNLKGFND